MSTTRLKTVLRTAGAVALSGLVLTGCGSSARPGVAIEVGDETISTSTVDSASAHLCTALGDEFSANGTVVPMGFIRQGVVQLMALSSTAHQIADEYGVEPGAAYEREVASRTRTAAAFPEEVRDDYVEVMSANALANDVLEQVGRAELAEQGFEDPTVDQVNQAGTDIFTSWPDANGIVVDPRYGVELVDGTLTPVDTNLSMAVGDDAKAGLATEPDPTYANTLPENHRCG
ncbi:hypothetical protein [Nocardioides sp. P5_C9_2]